jgi:GNAT superfamily N-acetyltransferase
MRLVIATADHLDELARMNKALIEDEGHGNPMALAALARRFGGFLDGGWSADLFEREGAHVGYALHRLEANPAEASGIHVHLRHFFITRDHRRRGFGRRAFEMLRTERFPQGARIVLDVLDGNRAGRGFWRSLGFAPYARTLEARN